MAVVQPRNVGALQSFLSGFEASASRAQANRQEARAVQSEQLDMTFQAAQRGLKINTGPDGKLSFSKMSPEENVVIQAKLANMEALALGKANVADTVRGFTAEKDLAFAESQIGQEIKELGEEERAEARETERAEKAKDLQSQVDAQVSTLESESGKKLTEIERKKIEEDITAKVKASAKAAVLPEVVAAQQQAAINKIFVSDSPEAKTARANLFAERREQLRITFADQLRQQKDMTEQAFQVKMSLFDGAVKELSNITDTEDVIRSSSAMEAALNLRPGALNPVTLKEQLRFLEDEKEQREIEKTAQSGSLAAALDPIITEALEGENIDINDLTDEDDLNELVGDPDILGSNKTVNTKQLRAMIKSIAESGSTTERLAAKAVLSKIGIKISTALDDVRGGDFFKTKSEEVRVIKKLQVLRDTLKEIAGTAKKKK